MSKVSHNGPRKVVLARGNAFNRDTDCSSTFVHIYLMIQRRLHVSNACQNKTFIKKFVIRVISYLLDGLVFFCAHLGLKPIEVNPTSSSFFFIKLSKSVKFTKYQPETRNYADLYLLKLFFLAHLAAFAITWRPSFVRPSVVRHKLSHLNLLL